MGQEFNYKCDRCGRIARASYYASQSIQLNDGGYRLPAKWSTIQCGPIEKGVLCESCAQDALAPLPMPAEDPKAGQ